MEGSAEIGVRCGGSEASYLELFGAALRASSGFASLGVGAGDRVALLLRNSLEFLEASIATVPLGASAVPINWHWRGEEIAHVLADSGAKALVLHADLWPALEGHVPVGVALVTVGEAGTERPAPSEDTVPGAIRWEEWMEAMEPWQEAPEAAPVSIIYTSGTTGKPKGIVHTTGGYLLGAHLTTKYVFDLREDDVYWCTADIGWVTGHSYVVYGPLSNGATTVMYEGAPDAPEKDRFWSIVERHKVSIFYTAPTAIRAFVRWGDDLPKKHDLSSLRLLGSVGEPINPEAWMWYHEVIGGGRCPIVDTWWQTETGGIMMTPLPGITDAKPGSCAIPFFGVDPQVVKRDGTPCGPNEGGFLIIKKPWPSMLRGIHGDPERYTKAYWSEIPGVYFTGDGSRQDEDGYYWVMGRVDDVLNVAGHRLGTAEIESALVSHPSVAEAAVVGPPHELKGQAIFAFVTPKNGVAASPELKKSLSDHVVKEIGALARPDEIRFTDALPKTRSGKIMRRLLREIATGGAVRGDVTTLEDIGVISRLSAARDDEE
jgi:acetyl-CoA synthetase